MMASGRAAIYGGTFDPVHNGHIQVARSVLKSFALDEVLFVPACVPPHKRNASITSAFHRMAMLALATGGDEQFRISTVELEAPEQPYAVETIGRLSAEFGDETELFFLMGADSWLEITSWHDWKRLLGLCNFIVVTRPGYELESNSFENMPTPIVNVWGQGCRQWDIMKMKNEAPHVFLTNVVMVDISATAIRAAARSGDREKLREMVPPPVANYIEKYELYQK